MCPSFNMRDKWFIPTTKKEFCVFSSSRFWDRKHETKYSQLKGDKDSINLIYSEFINYCKFLFVTIIPIYSNFPFFSKDLLNNFIFLLQFCAVLWGRCFLCLVIGVAYTTSACQLLLAKSSWKQHKPPRLNKNAMMIMKMVMMIMVVIMTFL